jgi:hypothetical protein
VSRRHRRIVLRGDDFGIRAARCQDCGAVLTRRIEGDDYVYVAYDERVAMSADRRR